MTTARLFLTLMLLTSSVSSCAFLRPGLEAAQADLAPYMFRFEGEVHGLVYASSMGFAVDAGVDVEVAFEKSGVPLWTKAFKHDVAPRAYLLKFKGNRLVLTRVPWIQAQTVWPGLPDRAAADFLPEATTMPVSEGSD